MGESGAITKKDLTEAFVEGARAILSEGAAQGKYIDVSRVPLICQAILGIHESLSNMERKMVTQDQFIPVRTLVYGAAGLILVAALGSLILLVLPHAQLP